MDDAAPRPAAEAAARWAPWLAPPQPPEIERLFKLAAERADVISFAGGLPADDLFPTAAVRTTLRQVMTEHGCEALQYQWSEGYEPLRAQICDVMRSLRGVDIGPEQILITHGAQQALDLIARLFLRTGDPLALESPTYPAAVQVFRLQRPRFCPIPRSEHGLDLAALDACFTRTHPLLFYVAAAGHNPTGDALSPETCAELLDVCRRHDALIIEDDAYGSIQFGPPRPPLRALPGAADHVLYVGSFSKIFSPGLRIGWIVAPPEIITQLQRLKSAVDLQTSSLSQIALSTYLAEQDLARHLDRCRAHYRARRDAMLAALAETASPGVHWTEPISGFSLWVTLPRHLNAESLLAPAIERGVAFEPGAAFFPTSNPPNYLRLSFSNHTPEVIAEGIPRLTALLKDALHDAPAG
jgi:DNA-binding transcriptional MocR family regulator